MHLAIRQAAAGDTPVISDILLEAAHWLQREGAPMWRDDEVTPERIASDVSVGSFYLAESAGEAIGTLKFQLSDPIFWPDVPTDESAFIHRVAVRRHFSGGTASSALLAWAAERAHALGRRYLRLDCEASRLRLRAVYERFGFQHHSDRHVGPYFVSRYELPLPRPGPNHAVPFRQAQGPELTEGERTPNVFASRLADRYADGARGYYPIGFAAAARTLQRRKRVVIQPESNQANPAN
jgi:GNAT superfamily N-acetyltransferase